MIVHLIALVRRRKRRRQQQQQDEQQPQPQLQQEEGQYQAPRVRGRRRIKNLLSPKRANTKDTTKTESY